jgi:hypothetical protein
MDEIQRKGFYPLPPQAPKTLGVEFSGIIESIGDGDHDSFKVGDEVFGLAYGGAYAEYIAVSSKMLLRKPKELSWEQVAGLPEVRLVQSIFQCNLTHRQGLDHGHASTRTRRRVQQRKISPLACWSLGSFDSRYPIVKRPRCQCYLCYSRFTGEMRVHCLQTRCNGRF